MIFIQDVEVEGTILGHKRVILVIYYHCVVNRGNLVLH
jgi:hypothetical protein